MRVKIKVLNYLNKYDFYFIPRLYCTAKSFRSIKDRNNNYSYYEYYNIIWLRYCNHSNIIVKSKE